MRAPAFRPGPRIVVGRPYVVRRPYVRAYPYYGYSTYGGGCEWIRQRALVTGSPYWWSRYRACRGY